VQQGELGAELRREGDGYLEGFVAARTKISSHQDVSEVLHEFPITQTKEQAACRARSSH
jgi:hypothetical protein